MRNPRKAVAASAGWRKWGARASQALDEVLWAMPEGLALAETIGTELSPGDAEQARAVLERMGKAGAAALARVTGATQDWDERGPTRWRWKLIAAVTGYAGDQDVDVAEWFKGNTPLGINSPIIPRGIFPPSLPTKAQRDSAEYLALRGTEVEVDSNYKSFHENEKESKDELARLVREGHLEIIGPWNQVVHRWPDARGTKLATLVKVKADGSTKTRFIADMRRSGINGLSSAEERIILPRGSDLMRDALDIMEVNGQEIEFFSADISDAFLNLGVQEEERGFAVVRTAEGEYASYRGVPFGLATAPLLWGRSAAWLGRATQAILGPWEGRTQIYVDDPIITLSGNRPHRSHLIAKILMLWSAFGARVALHKASRGHEVKWIGAQFRVFPGGVEVAIDKDRIDKLLKVTQQGLGRQGLIYNIRSLAGELSWVAGIIPSVRPFVNMIWAATYAMDKPQPWFSKVRKRPPDAVFAKMVRLPFKWLRAFLEGNHGGLTRKRLLWDRHAPAQWSVRTDASTTGLGGILLDTHGTPIRWWACPIPEEALRHLRIERGVPGLMTVYELLALLISIIIWGDRIRNSALALQPSSTASLPSAWRSSSHHPTRRPTCWQPNWPSGWNNLGWKPCSASTGAIP